MCSQAEMSHAVIAYLYLKESGLLDQINLNVALTSIIMTNMAIPNSDFKTG